MPACASMIWNTRGGRRGGCRCFGGGGNNDDNVVTNVNVQAPASPTADSSKVFDQVLIDVRDLKSIFPSSVGVMRRTVATSRPSTASASRSTPGETLGLGGRKRLRQIDRRALDPATGRANGRNGPVADRELTTMNKTDLRRSRRHMQIFQDSYACLATARMTVGNISEPLVIHGIGDSASRKARPSVNCCVVGLNPYFVNRYPTSFPAASGSASAWLRALATNPSFIVDELIRPGRLDPAQVVNMLDDLKQELGLTYLFIAHDLSMVRYISDRVAVMYLGRIVELSSRDEVYDHPLHPYTQALLSAIPA